MSKDNGIEGEIIAIIGQRKSGKTTTGLEMMEDVPNEVLFAREVHGDDWTQRGANIMTVPALVDRMQTAVDEVFIFEDATPLFSGRVSDQFSEAMVRTRNEGVSIVLMFHSFRKTPNDIFDMVNKIVIHKSRDLEFRITDRTDDPRILEAFRKVKSSDNRHAKAIINLDDESIEYENL